ncbi:MULTISPECIES: ATP-binding cassette domain-containing protein [unclassified Variovorax]|uniref:ABC transporter ATP-binding protein n=1 Tax=unclassified Variovorax TaxID=663243 RepID=UPI0008D46BD5|nr:MULTISPECIES: ATP-binding cassette domain-containing protein [unclassified Variovorax]SEK16458.1 iron(III) transport system ATP-binding protein/iron complex transport system ATP-binding protein/putative ABC transport system ATP-binding protein [Variovorax sp. OK202]SFE48505.1 ABC transporter [Variovorax sp. OK212]
MTEQRPFLDIHQLRTRDRPPVDLQAQRGECICILGKSGSGKSVLLRLVADLDPGEGTVRLDGADRNSWPGPEWRKRVVYQAAEPAWWGATAAEHFPADAREPLRGWLRDVGLDGNVLDTDIARLSTGERQRLALLRSLARKPAVLLLDEPTASLDHATTLAVEALLSRQLAAGLAILMVTHSQEQAQRIAHRCFHMAEGRLQPA